MLSTIEVLYLVLRNFMQELHAAPNTLECNILLRPRLTSLVLKIMTRKCRIKLGDGLDIGYYNIGKGDLRGKTSAWFMVEDM